MKVLGLFRVQSVDSNWYRERHPKSFVVHQYKKTEKTVYRLSPNLFLTFDVQHTHEHYDS
jgi:hypothetical protein